MRKRMVDYEFVKGCDSCIWQIRDGNLAADDAHYRPIHAMKYDELSAAADGNFWPANMEFNLSNACNLECVMCYGELSSLIRARRDKLPPLPKAYRDDFFEDLRKFLPHLQSVSFLGGEPFLIQEHYRVWDMLIEMQVDLRHYVTTNGTQFHAKVQRVLEHIPTSINLSMDGVRKETLESIRLNLHYDTFLQNFHRFHEYCRSRQTAFGVNFTLMRMNWRELRELLAFADAWDCNVSICTATEPAHVCLFSLDKNALGEVVEELQRQQATAVTPLTRNLGVWEATLAMLVRRLENFDDGALAFSQQDGPRKLTAAFASERLDAVALDDAALATEPRSTLSEWAPGAEINVLECDLDDRLTDISTSAAWLGTPTGDDLIGATDQEVFSRLRSQLGETAIPLDEVVTLERTDRIIRFTDANHPATDIRVITVPRYDAAGTLIGSRTFVARR